MIWIIKNNYKQIQQKSKPRESGLGEKIKQTKRRAGQFIGLPLLSALPFCTARAATHREWFQCSCPSGWLHGTIRIASARWLRNNDKCKYIE
jgi:hypothetical protein